MSRRNPLLWFALLVLLSTGGARAVAWFVTDGLWFASLGLGEVWQTTTLAQVSSALAVAALAALAVGGSGGFALRHTRNRPIVLTADWQGTVLDRWVRQPDSLPRAVRALTLAAAALGGLVGWQWWTVWLAALHAVDFGHVDPILGFDAGFHVFLLPAIELARGVLQAAVLAAGAVGLGIYVLRGAITVTIPEVDGRPGPPQLTLDAGPRRHLAILAATAVLLMAVGLHLDRFDVLHGMSPRFDGPGYTAVNVVMPLLTAQAVATALAGFLVFRAVETMRGGPIAGSVLLVGLTVAARSLAPGAVQQFVVEPNELAKEQTFIAAHTAATRLAWGIEEVEERALTGAATLSWDDIQANQATLDSVRIWDHDPLLATFGQLQEIRTYYEFSQVDNDRYVIDGQLRQTMLSPREMDPSGLDQQARTWVNQTLVYTHGYGVALGPVNEVSDQGLPQLWVKDLPPVISHDDALGIDRPGLYFGETMDHEVFVRTGAEEFDFPTADGGATTRYEGEGGVEVGGFARRALMALRAGDVRVLLSGDITTGSRMLMYRSVVDRVRRVAPFLHVDDDAYLAVVDGKMVWVVEAYGVASTFPLSATRRLDRHTRGGVNYVRNSVKAVIDAYDGSVVLYRMPVDDPIADVWSDVFPTLFTPYEEMPQGVRAHLRYPQSLFDVQARLFATYHMRDSQEFYNREDEWSVPVLEQALFKPTVRMDGTRVDTVNRGMEPYYTIMRLPGEDREEFILMLPFTPRSKENLAAWMVARSDGEHYGKLRVYRFPKDRVVYGPSQVAARINQNDLISEKRSLWDQQGSRAPLGTLLVIPIEESLLYIQPLYLVAEDLSKAVPELKRVIVGYEDRIAMAPTLDMALRDLFAAPTAAAEAAEERRDETTADAEATWQALGARARDAWNEAQRASADGRWTDFGRAMDRLGDVVNALDTLGAASDDELPPAADAAPPTP